MFDSTTGQERASPATRPISAVVVGRRRGAASFVRRYWAPYLFISPFYILFALFGLFPPLFGFYLSFQRWDGLTEQVFVGLRNYELVLTDDLFWKALSNNLIIAAISTVPGLSLALVC